MSDLVPVLPSSSSLSKLTQALDEATRGGEKGEKIDTALPEEAPKVATAQQHFISCPYCKRGGVVILVEHYATGELQVQHYKEPRLCEVCKKYFMLRSQLVISGRPMVAGGK